jgi:hypothetical protein
MNNTQKEIECCPKFDPTPWEGKVFEWSNKKFIKDKAFSVFFIPINFGQVMTRMQKKVDEAGVDLSVTDFMCLSDHTSMWNIDQYLAVEKEVPGAENVNLSGKFLSKVYEGDFKDTEKWTNDFKAVAKEKGFEVKKWYMWYTTCPKCAKKYGKNYVVILGQVG